jgi:hypothetical protein
VPLEVIGAGFGRTGTMSTYTALRELGLPCYHMIEMIENPANRAHLDFWLQVANSPPGTVRDWETVFAGYRAALDNPACCVWRELMTAYPHAKVLLTVHPKGPEAWYESTLDTIYFTESSWQFKVIELFTPFGRKFGAMSRRLIWQRNLGNTMRDRAAAIAFYQQHIETVKANVPPERLLVFSVADGWEPLCRFLSVPAPSTPFPNVNDRAQIKQTIAGIVRGAYTILAGLAALIALVLYGVLHAIGS